MHWALILGSSSGFGASTAIDLAKKGFNIYGVHLDRKSTMPLVEEVISKIKAEGVDVVFQNMSATDTDKRNTIINDMIDKKMQFKVMMHSIAFGALKPIIDDENAINQKQIEMTLDVMASSIVYWTQDLFTNKLFVKGSHVFAMTSAGGHLQWKSYGAVSAAKAALESYCRQIAFELSEHNISCNAIQAGVTDTPALRKIPGNEEMIKNATKNNPGKRLTLPSDVASVITMISQSNDTWMTGNTIRVDGGEDLTG